MTERRVDREVAELAAKPAPGAALPEVRAEVLSRAAFGASAATLALEAASTPEPPGLAAELRTESLTEPWPPIAAATLLVEVLRRDTAASGIVATGMDAFGDAPWPDAQRGVFAFRHDWNEPLLERLVWQTSVTRLASGNESRQARRRVPRRLMTYQVGHARPAEALVADWLADHLGKPALWPLPQYTLHLAQRAERGALALAVAEADGLRLVPPAAELLLSFGGLRGWQGGDRWVLICAAEAWQLAQIALVEDGLLWLTEPLARGAAAGASVMPLVWGTAVEPSPLTQWVPGMAGSSVTATLSPSPPPDLGYSHDALLDDLRVWPDGNWRDDPTSSVEAVITRQDFSPAEPWIRRDDPWPVTTFQRRYLASTLEEIEIWRERLWRIEGRLNAFWLPDGLAPVLWVTHEASPEDGFLRVAGGEVSAFWHRPAACVITHPDGTPQYALTSTAHADQGGVLVLRSGLDEVVPAGSRVCRLARCRLDHDAVDLYWHSPQLLELTLTARHLPEPRGHTRQTYEGE